MADLDDVVTDYEEVLQNMKQFMCDIYGGTEIVEQVTQFKHWYFIPELQAFGPGKYIGYKEMNTEIYDRGAGKSSVETGKVLKSWFEIVEGGSKADILLREQLTSLLALHGKKLRANAVFHLPKNTFLMLVNDKVS
ncbi:hypothetical protein LCL95_00745 [Bacillus timonensis]|nr:hypothetical protein [Bacillus timonensis]